MISCASSDGGIGQSILSEQRENAETISTNRYIVKKHKPDADSLIHRKQKPIPDQFGI